MKTKWYLGALITILTLFGINQESLMVPNQEIVLQFSNAKISSNEAKLVISNVKKQLETIGVANVGVSKEANGRLVISYYSNTTIANVKSILSIRAFTTDYTSNKESKSEFPKEQAYNLNVFEIQKSSDTDLGSNEKFIFELKQDYDRFSNPNFYVYAPGISLTEKNIEVTVAYKLNKTIAIAINNIPHKIPEGRAGPVS